jgi:hypothetical protein
LTTFTDHRPTPLGKEPDVQTADNGSDQQLDSPATRSPTFATPTATERVNRSLAKKVLDDSRPKRKRPCLHREQELTAENQMPGVADLAKPAATGGYPDAGFQNLLLNLYSLVKEHPTWPEAESKKT